ncbi:iron-siderophore ABC transporter substrate-binding protein [Vibrio agarivorans]|uniref:Iron-siderophore ABC transporter substrate-binding protein n=1 Tax=Vibrio agarivorans TaxID=153622 RepID=A0ABT7Y609_9VIBR|nr:iron-siderophore ABC transporter substrate-binding protein [Vibrio agarivorans]MDN2483491.1 iron-siderophore ABC transporter substrate-binding protein [Vibrio agarivorans]
MLKLSSSLLCRAALLLLTVSSSVLAQHTVMDSRGEQVLDSIPQRVAALNWDIAEQVIELGIAPIAMPDIKGYNEWVVKPAVPAETQDIGTRVEPNYAALRALKPDVIIIASPQKDLESRLSQIAPVLYYQTFSEQHNNAQAAITNFKHIAQALGKTEEAESKITFMNERIEQLNIALDSAFSGNKPHVSSFRFASTTSVYLYGGNSIPQYALEKLGFEAAIEKPDTQWGITQVRITELSQIGNNIALYFEPLEQKEQLERSVIWQNMPFVKAQKVNAVEPVWSYGGAMSILYNAEAIAAALLEVAHTQ